MEEIEGMEGMEGNGIIEKEEEGNWLTDGRKEGRKERK